MKVKIDKSERLFIASPAPYHRAFKKKAAEIAEKTNTSFKISDLVGLVGKIPTKDLINYLNSYEQHIKGEV